MTREPKAFSMTIDNENILPEENIESQIKSIYDCRKINKVKLQKEYIKSRLQKNKDLRDDFTKKIRQIRKTASLEHKNEFFSQVYNPKYFEKFTTLDSVEENEDLQSKSMIKYKLPQHHKKDSMNSNTSENLLNSSNLPKIISIPNANDLAKNN